MSWFEALLRRRRQTLSSRPPWTSRLALASDLPALQALATVCFGATSLASQSGTLSYWIQAGKVVLACSSANQKVVGYAVVFWDGQDAIYATKSDEFINGRSYVAFLGVDPSFRRSGVARFLMRKLLTSSSSVLTLHVRASHEAARRLYTSLGFVVERELPSYYGREDGDKTKTSDAMGLLMRHDLILM